MGLFNVEVYSMVNKYIIIAVCSLLSSCINSSSIELEEFRVSHISFNSSQITLVDNCGKSYVVSLNTLNMSADDVWDAYFNNAIIMMYNSDGILYSF